MFLEFACKNLRTFTLATCGAFTLINCAAAQIPSAHGEIRNLPEIDRRAPLGSNKAKRLFTIKEAKSLPPIAHLSKAKIVRKKSVAAAAVEQQTPPVPRILVTLDPPASPVKRPPSVVVADEAGTISNADTGRYTVAFHQPIKVSQRDEAGTETAEVTSTEDAELSELQQLGNDDLKMSKSGADGEVETDELDDSDGADVLGLGEQGTEDESDQETEDYGFDDEDDTPVERREFGAWPMKSIRQVGLDLSERDAAAPEDRSIALFESSTRYDDNVASTDKLFAWAAPNIRYQPLFFEDVALERYGQTKGLVKQPLISAGKFFADRFLLGSRALRDCPSSCDGPLGFCRPGSPSSSLNGGCGCACEDRPQADCQTCR